MRSYLLALVILGSLAYATQAQDSARLVPAKLLLPPIVPSHVARPSSLPEADDEPDLPPRAARLRLPTADNASRRLHSDELAQAQHAAPQQQRIQELRGDELFDYLADVHAERRATGRAKRPDQERASQREPAYDQPANTPFDMTDWYLGKRLHNLFSKEREGWFFCSDHEFESMISPVTNPFLFEDPRAMSEIRPLFIYQNVPNAQPNFQGGNIWFAGATGRIAFTERLSLVINKLGVTQVDPKSPLPRSGTSFAELWFGPKYTFFRDVDAGRLLAGGVQFQLPIGGANAYQNTGDLSVLPYASFGQSFLTSPIGTFNLLGSGGYAFSINRKRSDYFFASGHLSLDVGNKQTFFPLFEANWIQYTANGSSNPFTGEGRDLINFGSASRGSGLVTGAAGARYRFTKHVELGGAYEFPMFGNRDFFRNRFTVDLIFRY